MGINGMGGALGTLFGMGASPAAVQARQPAEGAAMAKTAAMPGQGSAPAQQTGGARAATEAKGMFVDTYA